jgi:preprotein translocase subunit SecE
MNAIVSYIKGSIEELRHVRWPTRQQSIRLTTIVIGFIIVTSIFFGLIDLLLSEIIRLTLVA